jgi:hypothetical protein
MGASRAIAIDAGYPATVRVRRPATHRSATHRPAMRRAGTQRVDRFLTNAIVGLKLLASALSGAAITLVLWPPAERPVSQHAPDYGSIGAVSIPAPRQESRRESIAPRRESIVYRSAPQSTPSMTRVGDATALQKTVDRVLPSEVQRKVQTTALAVPAGPDLSQPAATTKSNTGALAGKPLRYLIGADAPGKGADDEVTVVSYGAQPAKRGISIAYCNLFDERNTGRYGPYLHTSGTAKQYNEGQIDPHGPGWERNLREQFERRKSQGFEFIELDNADAYSVKDVIGAIELAASYGLKVIAKNPLLLESGAKPYVAHANVHGIIVERGAGGADEHDALRRKVGKPDLPTWFVSFGSGRSWANGVAGAAKHYRNMGVTYSSAGEYGNSIDVLTPTSEPSRS